MSQSQNVTILGATGSIGCSTLDVLAAHPDRYSVFALTGRTRLDVLAAQCVRHRPRMAVVGDAQAARDLAERIAVLDAGKRQSNRPDVEIRFGREALEQVASAAPVTTVMAAIVGAAGLAPTLAAARAGKKILLANKEALVMAGDLFMQACRDGGARLLPVDSEHNAVFQCLPPAQAERVSRAGALGGSASAATDALAASQAERSVRRIILTASGGPFRTWTVERMMAATPDQACAHPNWSMGRKISIDSATLMNKGLELIEAHYLFHLPPDAFEVVVHPQSIVHSMVEYVDGSTLAQLGNPDMKTPIAHALAFPDRIHSGVAPLSLPEIGRLDFELPDPDRFPCLRHAAHAMATGGAAPCVLNAANEVSVQAFLDGKLGFADMARINGEVLEVLGGEPGAESIDSVMAIDAQARALARERVGRR